MGRERLDFYLAELRKKGDAASKKEQDTIKDMRIVQEMYARGLEFMPIDLYRAKANRFQIKDDFRDRTKVSKTVIDLMDDLGLFGDIPQSNQFSLFDGVIA